MAEVIEQRTNVQETVPSLSQNGTQIEENNSKTLKQLPQSQTQTSEALSSENILQNGVREPETSSSSENVVQNGDGRPEINSSSPSENVVQNGDDRPDTLSQTSEDTAQSCEEEIDASAPLLQAEVDAVIESFTVLWKAKKENGIELFIKFFTLHPEAQEIFEDFRGITLEEVRVHKKLRAHALSVLYAVKSYVDNLDDLETLEELVRKTARNHKPRGVGGEKMGWILQPLLELVEDKMGKDVTKLHRSGWTKVFHVISALTKDEQKDEEDDSAPMSEEEINAINESFKVLWKEKKENGIELFIRFFTRHPAAQDIFDDFKGLTLEEVRGHKKLRAHVLSVMYAIKSYVDNLDDSETLEQLVRKTARSHKPRGVDAEKMGWLVVPFVELLEDKMEVTDLHRSGWKKVFHAIFALTKDEQENTE